MLADVQALAGDIGPRGTGTRGEQAAAEYVTRRLAALGLPVERHNFRAVASQNAFPLAICVVTLSSVALYPLAGAFGRWIAAVFALSAAPMLWQTIRTSNNPLRPFLPQVASSNVVAQVKPQGKARQHAVILAHLDTNRCRLVWQSSSARSLEPLTWLTLAMLAAPGVLYLAGALRGGLQTGLYGVDWPWLASLPSAVFVIGMVFTLRKDDRAEFSCGAHDNAASVAVALEVGARLVARCLPNTQVWLAFTGAEETDHAGLYELLDRHGAALRQASFIGLEGLGSGELVYLTRQGLCDHYRPDSALLDLASRVARRHPEFGAQPAEMTGEDETGTLRRSGYRALCLAGRDPATGTLPHWHRPDDTPDKVSHQFMERAAGFLLAFLEELDKSNRPHIA